MKNLLKKIYSPVYLQIIYWTILYFLEINRLSVFIDNYTVYTIAFIRIIAYALVINFNVFFLIPKVFYKKHYILYIITVLLLVVGTSILLGKIELSIYTEKVVLQSMELKQLEYFKKGLHLSKSLPLMGLLFLTTVYTLGKRKDEKIKKHLREKAESELRLLKNQINPHFLFNALNSVYTLSYIKSDLTPQMILKLSEMLRYVLYECSEDKVTLEKELIYLQNYIIFQNLKEETEKSVEIDFANVDKTKLVAPMLFIPFIENSFKHSKISSSSEAFIKIKMETTENKLVFTIQNSIPDNPDFSNRSKGIGLENVKRRLKLIYLDKYNLEIDSSQNIFSVNLTLDLI